jgi:hypothetical protein
MMCLFISLIQELFIFGPYLKLYKAQIKISTPYIQPTDMDPIFLVKFKFPKSLQIDPSPGLYLYNNTYDHIPAFRTEI